MERNEDRPLFEATCADCGNVAKVPFEPSGNRPVYCQDCFPKHRAQRGAGGGGGGGGGMREMHDATCADCGTQTQVPFKPSGDRPVYCRDCYQKHRQ